MSSKDDNEKLLEQIRDLLVLSLRSSEVPTASIAKVLGVKPKTVRNRYPVRESENSQEEEQANQDQSQPPSATPLTS